MYNELDTCDKCPPGYGLVSMCNSTRRTVCQPCTLSISYSAKEPHFRPCMPCSKCGDDMYEEVSCTTVSDTFCDSCSTKKGYRNDDYAIKCNTRDENDFEKLDTRFEFDRFDNDDLDSNEDDAVAVPDKGFKGFDIDDELDSVLKETEKEMDKVSKEEEIPDNFGEELKKVMDDIDEEMDDDYKLEINLNVSDFEKSIDDSIKSVDTPLISTVDNDESSEEDVKSWATDDIDKPFINDNNMLDENDQWTLNDPQSDQNKEGTYIEKTQ